MIVFNRMPVTVGHVFIELLFYFHFYFGLCLTFTFFSVALLLVSKAKRESVVDCPLAGLVSIPFLDRFIKYMKFSLAHW